MVWFREVALVVRQREPDAEIADDRRAREEVEVGSDPEHVVHGRRQVLFARVLQLLEDLPTRR